MYIYYIDENYCTNQLMLLSFFHFALLTRVMNNFPIGMPRKCTGNKIGNYFFI